MASQLLILITMVTMGCGMKSERLPYTIFKWNKLEFGFPNDEAREDAETSGNLIPTNAIPIDVQPVYSDDYGLRTFVTIPKFSNGIPYTLATVSHETGRDGPVLQPYPNYAIHQTENGANCDAITSAFRMVINECNQMWIIDTGMQSSRSQCPPQLLLIDLDADKIIHRYTFDDSLYTKDASLFITPIVNVKDPPAAGNCRNTMVYIADVTLHGLVVYDYRLNRAWRIENRFMYPDPNRGLLTVANKSFVLMDGLLSLATDKKKLYFHPLASISEFSVPLRVIDNRTLIENDAGTLYKSFIKLGERKSPCPASAIDRSNNLYCVTLQPIELIKWNVKAHYSSCYMTRLPIRPEELEFVSGIKVVENKYGFEELWMISNKFQDMATESQDFNEINFRILKLHL